MKNGSLKKLRLSKLTLANLDGKDMSGAHGAGTGNTAPNASCGRSCLGTICDTDCGLCDPTQGYCSNEPPCLTVAESLCPDKSCGASCIATICPTWMNQCTAINCIVTAINCQQF